MQNTDGEQLCYELCREYLSNAKTTVKEPATIMGMPVVIDESVPNDTVRIIPPLP